MLSISFENLAIENAASAQLRWIDPHIDLQQQLGYYNLSSSGNIAVTDQKFSFKILSMDNLPAERQKDIRYTVLVLAGTELINMAEADMARFLVLFLSPVPMAPVPGDPTARDIMFIKQQLIQKNLQVWQGHYDHLEGHSDPVEMYRNVANTTASFVLSSSGMKDLALLAFMGPDLSGLSFLNRAGFSLETTINSLYARNFIRILRNGQVEENVNLFDNRHYAAIDYEIFRDDIWGYSTMSQALDSSVLNILNAQTLVGYDPFADIIISRNQNVFSLIVGLDKVRLLQNQSIYYNILNSRGIFAQNPAIRQKIVQSTVPIEVRIDRSRVKVAEGCNELGVPIMDVLPLDDYWDTADELIAIGGDDGNGKIRASFGQIETIQLRDNAYGSVEYMLATDSTLYQKTTGYYQYTVRASYNDGARDYLRDLLFEFRNELRWFEEYRAFIVNNAMFSKNSQYLSSNDIEKLRTMYGSQPPWVLVIRALQKMLYGFVGESEQLSRILGMLQTWIRPESLSDTSLGNFAQIVFDLEYQITQFLNLSNFYYTLKIEKRFANHLADAEFDRQLLIRHAVPSIDPGILKVPAGGFAERFPRRVETATGTAILPAEVVIGSAKLDLAQTDEESVAFSETILSGVVHAKMMNSQRTGTQMGSSAAMLPGNASQTAPNLRTSGLLSNRLMGSLGASFRPSHTAGADPSATQDGTLVGDGHAPPSQPQVTGDTLTVTAGTRTVGVRFIESSMEDGLDCPVPLPSLGWRETIDGRIDHQEIFDAIPGGVLPGRPLQPGTFSYEQFAGVQYCIGYEKDGNGNIDVRHRRWTYVKERDLPSLAHEMGQTLLCRVYREIQRAKDNGLQIPIENEYFLVEP
jgi:hypothetical protein